MGRSFAAVCALALAAPVLLLPVTSKAVDRTLPMHFDLRQEGPAKLCGTNCRTFIRASGAITADTPRDFENFAQGRNLSGALVVLDSDGGSVHGAIALGRDIRRLNLDTTVGDVVDVADAQGTPRGKLVPRADCESMCAFVLLAGVHRDVPKDARVMVHQIWLGDRRDDPTAASYSAEDLVLVQRDIGKLAQYTIDMGASIEVLDLALRIPPWEPMHTLTADEIRRARVATVDDEQPASNKVAASPPAPNKPSQGVTSGLSPTTISERHWAVVQRSGATVLARHHPLTVEGEEIGSFDLFLACGTNGNSYEVSYVERRNGDVRPAALSPLRKVTLRVGGGSAKLKVVSSEHRSHPDDLVSYAIGTVPASLIDTFAGKGDHSMTIRTRSAKLHTGIRIGNTGARKNLPDLAEACKKAPDNRADLPGPKTRGMAAAK
jgi:hypothetical protein